MVDLPNAALCCNSPALPHNLDDMVESIVRETTPTFRPSLAGLTRDVYLRWSNSKPSVYVEVSINNFLGLDQGTAHRQLRVRKTLFHALDNLFRPRDSGDSTTRKEVLSLKKILERYCTWSTCQVILGWFVDTFNMTLSLPPHR